jgi:KDO2-lipid IV(A) lauroyltransferase
MLPARTAYWIGLRMGDLYHRRRHEARKAVISNIRQIYASRGIEPAEDNLKGMARKTFQYFGKYIVDFFRTARFTPEQIRRIVSFEHREYLEEATARNRGVICVSAHFGNWEIAGAVLESLGHKINVVVLPDRLRKLERLLESRRRMRGFNTIPLGNAARGVMRCLKRGEMVAMLADRDFSGRTIPVNFFGRPARMPEGPAWLSLHTGAPILPTLLIRQEDDTFLFRFHRPLYPEEEKTVESIQRKLCAFLESNIAERPYQWFIFEDYWRS